MVAGPHIPIPPQKYGGAEQIVHYLIRGLVEQGHEVILLGPGNSKADCEIIPIVPRGMNFPRTPGRVRRFNERVNLVNEYTAEQIRRIAPRVDVIHSHGFDMRPFPDIPHLTTLHVRILLTDFEYFDARNEEPFVSISRNQQEAHPGLNYLGVVHNSEDPGEFPVVTEPDDYLCFLGRFDPDKNPHLAIQLAIHLGMKIKLGGKVDFEGYDYFRREVRPYLGHPLVEFLGELNFKQKVELIAHAKCNLHPTSFREPFGLSVIEAAYCGTPTLAIARGAMPEIIVDHRTGLLVEDFVQGFHHIRECFEMDRAMVAATARRRFHYKLMTKKYVSMYKKVLRQTAAGVS